MTDRLHELLAAAAELAEQRREKTVGTEHVLLALFDLPGAPSVDLLRTAGGTKERIERKLDEIAPAPANWLQEASLYGPLGDHDGSLARATSLASDEALAAGCETVDVEHLLLGLYAWPLSPAAQTLVQSGFERASLRPSDHDPAQAGTPPVEFSAEAVRLLDDASAESLRSGNQSPDSTDLLATVLQQPTSPAARHLAAVGVNLRSARKTLVRNRIYPIPVQPRSQFAVDANEALEAAFGSARRNGAAICDTQHLLHGLMAAEGAASAALADLGVTPQLVTEMAINLDGEPEPAPLLLDVSPPLRTSVLAAAQAASDERRVTGAHLLMGLCGVEHSNAHQILTSGLGVALDELESTVRTHVAARH